MGGSGGVIIVQESAVKALTDPTVHGNLPGHMTPALDQVLKKTPGTWTKDECKLVADAFTWAICHLA